MNNLSRAMPLPSVIKHITKPAPQAAQASIASSACHFRPKPALQDGRVPGMYHNLFVTSQNPAAADAPDQSQTELGSRCLVAGNGINFRVTDVAPRTSGHMHKTPSLDFLVVHKGRITLHLEGGAKQSIGEGEAIVQRGTVHAWESETDEWVRMFVVLVAAKEEGEAPSYAS